MFFVASRPFRTTLRGLVAVLVPVFLLGGAARAQSDADVTVSAQAQPAEVGTAGTVTFTIQVKGASVTEVQTPKPPSTTNLTLRKATPQTRREVSFNSGRLTRRLTFEWTYKPVRVGVGRIRAATVRIRGEAYTTDEVRVRIVPQSQRPARARGPAAEPRPRAETDRGEQKGLRPRDLFIRATASADTAYQNEQVTVEYRLFFRPSVRLRQSRMADAWDAPGFWREELDVASRPTPRARQIFGQTYKAIVLKRVALFPTRPGTLSVDPLRIETEARARPQLGRRDGPVPRSRYEPVTLSSEQLTVAARPLPPSAPPAFDGAVGQFALDTRVGPDSVAVGESVEVTARVEGTGNIATVSPPALGAPSAFEAYEPTVEAEIDRGGGAIRGTKTFTYTLVPRSGGTYTLPPLRFAYFDPEAGRYETLRSAPATVRVTGTAESRATSRTGDGLPIGDIAEPIEQPDRWVRVDPRPLYARPWIYAALLGALVLAVGGVAYRRRGPRAEAASSPASGGPDDARAFLRNARRHLREEEARAFHRAVEQGVLAFLEARLDLPRAASGMTGEALDRHLARRGAARADREALHEVLRACNEAQFAPAEPAPDAMETTLERADALLRRLDDHLPT
ncbi:MAG: BatD family protein [Salinibacter sp.]